MQWLIIGRGTHSNNNNNAAAAAASTFLASAQRRPWPGRLHAVPHRPLGRDSHMTKLLLMSMTKRNFTSPFSMRLYASFT